MPDNIDLDVIGSPDGRPTEQCLHFKLYVSREDGETLTKELGYADYGPGHKRISLTARRTKYALNSFKAWVEAHGDCRCRRFFGID